MRNANAPLPRFMTPKELSDLPDLSEMEQELARLRTGAHKTFLLCYEISSLRRVNYVHGRHFGDSLLLALAIWVSKLVRRHIYRIDNNFFCILFEGVSHHHVADLVLQIETRCQAAWELILNGRHSDIFTNLNLAIAEDSPTYADHSIADILAEALDISRQTKQTAFFDREAHDKTLTRVQLQLDLKQCILRDMHGFDVFFQPIADPTEGTWQGLEALCRWTGPVSGWVPPNVFIPEVEEMGLIHILGEWVLDTAVRVCKNLALDRLDEFFVSVNVSAQQITYPDFAQNVLDVCTRHQYPCHKLLLEITESTEFTFNDLTTGAVENLRSRGVKFALDDFGTGYSGFNNLKHLPVDFLKTEREFTHNIENDNYLQYFYFVMSETAHASGKLLIAEGIETREQLSSIIRNGADLIQGYLFGKPMDREELRSKRLNFSQAHPDLKKWAPNLDDFRRWLSSQDAYKITPALFGLMSRCMNIVLEEGPSDAIFDKVLGAVGAHFKANRSFIFLRDEGTLFSNRYEWCAPGVPSQKHLFQRVDGALDGFYEILCDNEIVLTNNSAQLPENLQQRLQQGDQSESIQSLLVLPLKRSNEILGFVGFDDSVSREWMPEVMIILHSVCLLVLIILCKDDKCIYDNAPCHLTCEKRIRFRGKEDRESPTIPASGANP